MPLGFNKPFSIPWFLLGLTGVSAITILFSIVIHANASTVGFIFLLLVLAIATAAGFRVAALVSLAAMLSYNFFFLPPVGRFTIADPENWVALITFLLTALVASHLSDRAQREAAEARRRQQETEQLYSLSRSILLTETSRPIGTQAAQSIAQIFNSPLVVIFDAKTRLTFHGGLDEPANIEAKMQDVIRQGTVDHDSALNLDIWPIVLGGTAVGALAAKNIRVSDGAIQSLLNLVAIALERVRTIEAANRAEVARQSEEFKSTLLDAIAHEFKTPLTSIKAASTGLQSMEGQLDATQQELAAIIEEETDRLSRLVTEAVKMAQIDAGKIKPQLQLTNLSDVLHQAAATFEGRGREQLIISASAEINAEVDTDLLTLALRQVIDNALKYGPPNGRIDLTLHSGDSRATIRIADHGPGVPEKDRDRIFDKFYRRAAVRDRIPGTGLGLHIAREIARIHAGDLWVEPNSDGGAVFCFAIPHQKVAKQ